VLYTGLIHHKHNMISYSID